jgi:hypothetical protein
MAHRTPTLACMDKHFETGNVTMVQKQQMLNLIKGEREATVNVINKCIDNMMVQVSIICGLRVPMNMGTDRNCASRSEVINALKVVPTKEHKAAIYMFMFNYFGKVVYEQTIGTTHQAACEAAVMVSLQVSFQGLEGMKSRNQTCIGKMYSTLLNRRQHKVHEKLYHTRCRVGVEKGGVSNSDKKTRRGKTTYYIHELKFDHNSTRRRIVASMEEVSIYTAVCFIGYLSNTNVCTSW